MPEFGTDEEYLDKLRTAKKDEVDSISSFSLHNKFLRSLMAYGEKHKILTLDWIEFYDTSSDSQETRMRITWLKDEF